MAASVLLVLTGTASAATVQVNSAGGLRYYAAVGETNTVTFDLADDGGISVVDSSATVSAGSGCDEVGDAIVCQPTAGDTIVWLGDGDDRAYDNRPVSQSFTAHGEAGNDVLGTGSSEMHDLWLDGGKGDDRLSSCCGSPSRLDGGSGADTITISENGPSDINAGGGNDRVNFQGYSSAGSTIALGAGSDVLAFKTDAFLETRTTPYGTFQALSIGEDAIRGGDGKDTVQADGYEGVVFDLSLCTVTSCEFEKVLGTPDTDDLLIGDGGAQTLDGRGGNDIIVGNGGVDRAFGGPGDDQLFTSGDGDLIDVLDCAEGADAYTKDPTDKIWGGCETAVPAT